MIQCLCSSSQTACTHHVTLLKNLYEDSHGMRKQSCNPNCSFATKIFKEIYFWDSRKLDNTLHIASTTHNNQHFGDCSNNYRKTLCTLQWQLHNNTLHIAATTLQQHFADCSDNTEDCKENSETLCRLQRKLHTTPLLKNAIANLKRVACNNVSDHNLHNE